MNIINLDKFSNVQTVEYNGVQYKVTGVTIDDHLKNTFNFDAIKTITDEKEKTLAAIEIVKKISDIPEAVILGAGFGFLWAIILVAQGIDPSSVKTPTVPEENTKKKQK